MKNSCFGEQEEESFPFPPPAIFPQMVLGMYKA